MVRARLPAVRIMPLIQSSLMKTHSALAISPSLLMSDDADGDTVPLISRTYSPPPPEASALESVDPASVVIDKTHRRTLPGEKTV